MEEETTRLRVFLHGLVNKLLLRMKKQERSWRQREKQKMVRAKIYVFFYDFKKVVLFVNLHNNIINFIVMIWSNIWQICVGVCMGFVNEKKCMKMRGREA